MNNTPGLGMGMDASILRSRLEGRGASVTANATESVTARWKGRARHLGVVASCRALEALERFGVRGRARCAICDWAGAEFRPTVESEWMQRNISCPSCGSVPRQRLVALALIDAGDAVSPALWTAPESCLVPVVARNFAQTVTVDIEMHGVDVHADLEALPLADGCLGAVLSVDVLEHVVDDRRVLAELRRALRPDGFALIHVPVLWTETVEYGFADPLEYGHRRGYGPDVVDKFRDAGFRVEEVLARRWSDADRRCLGLLDWDVAFVLRKA